MQQFEGFDYQEILEKWNLFISDEIADVQLFESNFLESVVDMMFFKFYKYNTISKPSRVGKKFCNDCRNYCKAMIENYPDHHYELPMWEGLVKIEDDWTFMKYFSILFKHAWS